MTNFSTNHFHLLTLREREDLERQQKDRAFRWFCAGCVVAVGIIYYLAERL